MKEKSEMKGRTDMEERKDFRREGSDGNLRLRQPLWLWLSAWWKVPLKQLASRTVKEHRRPWLRTENNVPTREMNMDINSK